MKITDVEWLSSNVKLYAIATSISLNSTEKGEKNYSVRLQMTCVFEVTNRKSIISQVKANFPSPNALKLTQGNVMKQRSITKMSNWNVLG